MLALLAASKARRFSVGHGIVEAHKLRERSDYICMCICRRRSWSFLPPPETQRRCAFFDRERLTTLNIVAVNAARAAFVRNGCDGDALRLWGRKHITSTKKTNFWLTPAPPC